MMPIRANIVGPPSSTTSISASMAACHSGRSRTAFGSAAMYSPASRSVTSLRPSTSIGSSKGPPPASIGSFCAIQILVRPKSALDPTTTFSRHTVLACLSHHPPRI
jgi:hypothetical protein